MGEKQTNLIGLMKDLIHHLDGKQFDFTGIEAARTRLIETIGEQRILLVIDDVWDINDLKPFIQGAPSCLRLITTRHSNAHSSHIPPITINEMQDNEAVSLLSNDLPGASSNIILLQSLANRLGKWPLLLKLASGVLRRRVREHRQDIMRAVEYIEHELNKYGLVAFDIRNSSDREDAVSKTLKVSFDLLAPDEYERYCELSIFPEDIDIPLQAVTKLWNTTSNSTSFDTERLCDRLYELSLLQVLDLDHNTIRLHDVFRSHLRKVLEGQLAAIHSAFLGAYSSEIPTLQSAEGEEHYPEWNTIDPQEQYIWDHLAYHLIEAKRSNELLTTLKETDYVAKKTNIRSARAVEDDIRMAVKVKENDTIINALQNYFALDGHVFEQCPELKDVRSAIYSRLSHVNDLEPFTARLAARLSKPYLSPVHLLPDLPASALKRTLVGHTGPVYGCTMSNDGSFIVSASHDGTLRVWDPATGKTIRTLSGHSNNVGGCAVSPDRKLIVSASDDTTLRIWDVETGETIRILKGHKGGVFRCAFTSDGSFIVSASADKTLRIWRTETGRLFRTLKGHASSVWGFSVYESLDRAFIASASDDGTIKIWDLKSFREIRTLEGHTDMVRGCAISADGSFIVSASYDNTVRVWDASTGAVRLILAEHTKPVNGCRVSPDGKLIVSTSHDTTIKIWNSGTGECLSTLEGHLGVVDGCAIHPDGSSIVSTSWDHTLKIWNMDTQPHDSGSHHITGVNSCAVTTHPPLSVVTSTGKSLHIWDAVTGAITMVVEENGANSYINDCAISSDGSFIVSASADKTLTIWEAGTSTLRVRLQGHTSFVNDCAISSDGSFVVSASADGTLKVWEAQTGALRATLQGHSSYVNCCTVGPDGSFIVSGSADQTLRIWNAATGALQTILSGHLGFINDCAVSPDGTFILSASSDQTVKVWSYAEKKCVTTMPGNGKFFGCRWLNGSQNIVAVGEAGVYFVRFVA
jgi:WD40 repeat protein